MNFLAHSLLGFDRPALIAGQICGDFVKGRELSHFPAGVEQGIRLHRHLDMFADSYAGFLAVKQTMTGVPRRFSGIIIDVLFDHHLARHWQQFSTLTLPEHAQTVHSALAEHHHLLPESLQRFSALLKREEILERNTELYAIERTLVHLSSRSPRFSALALGQAQLRDFRESLHQPFEAFYPDLDSAARQFLNKPAKEIEP